jgi:hypothetical protein
MFLGIVHKDAVARLHRKFEAKLKPFITSNPEVRVGHKGKSWKEKVNYSEELGIWWILGISNNKTRNWNAFGIGDPTKIKPNIIVEINYPLMGKDFNISGNWACDENANVYLFHSGKLNRIKKQEFIDKYTGGFYQINVDGRSRESAMIGALDDENFSYQVAEFVNEVAKIKGATVPTRPKSTHTFSKEFDGTRIYNIPQSIKASGNHAIVVNSLADYLTSTGLKVGSNGSTGRIDLYLYNNRNVVTHIFEVKSSLSIQSTCTAIGQLLLYKFPFKNTPKMIYVCPDNVSQKIKELMGSLNIELLLFKIKKGKPVFVNIDKFSF